jgi:hypothetical protein
LAGFFFKAGEAAGGEISDGKIGLLFNDPRSKKIIDDRVKTFFFRNARVGRNRVCALSLIGS